MNDYVLLQKYGLSRDQYRKMLTEQDSRCAICKKDITDLRSCIDHDHESGIVRGILCTSCNTGIGCFQDDPWKLESAINYLKKREVRV